MAASAQRSGLTPLTEIAMTTRLDAARLRGIFPALPTPVRADDTVDADAASRRVDPVALAAQTAHHNARFQSPSM